MLTIEHRGTRNCYMEEAMKLLMFWTALPLCLLGAVSLAQAADGGIFWAEAIGGPLGDAASVGQQTRDGGYFVAGDTGTGTAADGWSAKLDGAGRILWQRSYAGGSGDHVRAGQQTTDGGYVLAGCTSSFGSGDDDGWLVKLDPWGQVSWQTVYGGTARDELLSIKQLTDGGYICGGVTRSYGSGNYDAWVLRLDPAGAILWQKAYGKADYNSLAEIIPTADGGFLFAGSATEDERADTWCVKLNADGTINWQRSYYNPSAAVPSQAECVLQTLDGGYIMGTIIWEGSAAATSCLKIDSGGALVWWKKYAGSCVDWISAIRQTSDGNYIVGIDTKIYGAGGIDCWLLKLDAWGQILTQQTIGGAGSDSISQLMLASDGGTFIAGSTTSFGSGVRDAFIIRASADGVINSTCQYLTTVSSAVPKIYAATSYVPTCSAIASAAAAGPGSASSSAASLTDSPLCSDTWGVAISGIKARMPKPGRIATISGSGFSLGFGKTTVWFGRRSTKQVTKMTATSFRVVIPPSSKGWVGVSVRSGWKTSNVFPFEVK